MQSRNDKAETVEECPFDGGEIPVARIARPPKLVVQADSEIERVAKTPMESLGFKDFIGLKSRRDQFSKMKSHALEAAIAKLDMEKLAAAFHDDSKSQATYMRWILRGLSVDKAIRKVRTDAEIAAKATSSKRR